MARVSRCCAGRDDVEVDYDVGFDGDGRLLGLRMRVRLLGGWAQDLATDDGVALKDGAGMVSAWQLDTRSGLRFRLWAGFGTIFAMRIRCMIRVMAGV